MLFRNKSDHFGPSDSVNRCCKDSVQPSNKTTTNRVHQNGSFSIEKIKDISLEE